MASIHGQASSMNVERNKLSSQVDRVVGLIETCCTVHVMSKSQAATYLFLQHDIEPTMTETVWNELERQNPEFFKDYNFKRVVRKQIDMHNTLFLAQVHAMPDISHNVTADSISGNTSMSTEMPHEMNGVANSHGHDPACGTSTQVIDPNNMQHDMVPLTSDAYHTILENIGVCAIDNASVSTLAGVPYGMNGVANHVPVRDPMCNTPIQVSNPNNMQCGVFPPTPRISEDQGAYEIHNSFPAFTMDGSARVPYGTHKQLVFK